MSAARAGASNKNPNIVVTVRIRPPSEFEKGNKDSALAVKCMDERVVIFDPADLNKPQHRGPQGVRRGKDIPFGFDRVFDQFASQYEVFQHTTQALVSEVLNGYNCACFAYGATGAGKTFTMVGTESAPGVMVLTLQELFSAMKATEDEKRYSVRISYLEVYNENIHDLLVPQSKPLQLLESGDNMTVLGLTQHEPKSADEILILLQEGNTRRAQNFTHANAESSRSHAVLQVIVEQRDRTANVTTGVRTAKFSLIDLAGSERASRTKNQGKQLVEGANINRSLLALGNCINALGNGYTEGKYVPYRDSKLTRLLKDSLGGNCKTVMISNVSPSTLSYEDTFNTLQYANRAKNIKTKVRANEINLVVHVSEYKVIIADLRKEVEEWKQKCARFEEQLEAEGRARQAAIDIEFEEQVSSLSGRSNMQSIQESEHEGSSTPRGHGSNTASKLSSHASAMNRAAAPTPNSKSMGAQQQSLPLLSRTVSMGLQTPRNMKTEKRILNLSSSIDDVVTDRRNVQKHLEEVNALIGELLAKQGQVQEQIRANTKLLNASPACEGDESMQSPRSHAEDSDLSDEVALMTPAKSKSKFPSPPRSALKRELTGLTRKLDEQYATRTTLLQRLARNAENSKRLQVEMSSITPHAEDAALYRQLKLELVINVLEISNFNRAMQESQLAHALSTSNEKTNRALELVDLFRSALRNYGYTETDDLVETCDWLAIASEEPLECANLPSPFARSPCVLTPPTGSEGDHGYDVPSTPSRFNVDANTAANATSHSVASSAVSSTHGAVASPRNTKTRIPFSIRQVDMAKSAAAGSKTEMKPTTAVSRVAASSRVGSHIRNTSHPSAKKSAVQNTKIHRQSMAPASNTSHAPSSVAAPSSVSRIPKTSVAASSSSHGAMASAVGAKKTAMGLPQRMTATRVVSVTGSATSTVGSARPFQTNSDNKRITPTKLSHRYRNDPAVVKALASFKPAFEPQEKSTPPSDTHSSATAKASAPRVGGNVVVKSSSTPTAQSKPEPVPVASSVSSVDVKSSPSVPASKSVTDTVEGENKSQIQNHVSSLANEPNPLAALLGCSTSSALPLDASMKTTSRTSLFSKPPTIGPKIEKSTSSPTTHLSYSPLLMPRTHTATDAASEDTEGPTSPLAKPLRV